MPHIRSPVVTVPFVNPPPRMGLRVAVVVTIIVALHHAAGFALALSYPPPVRPLTSTERAELSVGLADVILTAQCTALFDTSLGEGTYFHCMEVVPLEHLKGSVGAGPTTIFFPDVITSGSYRMLLRHRAELPISILILAHRVGDRWVVSDDPNALTPGVLLTSDPHTRTALLEFRSAIRELEDSRLAARSDAIVIATPKGYSGTCGAEGHRFSCTPMRVDTVVAGVVRDSIVSVFTSLGRVQDQHRCLLMLRRAGDSLYEVVGFDRGVRQIQGRNFRDSVEQVDSAVVRLRDLYRAAHSTSRP